MPLSHTETPFSRPAITTQAVTTQAITAQAQTNIQTNTQTALPTAGTYAYIPDDNVYFYPVPSEQRGIFLLPKTYYVRLLEYQPDFCRIEYLYDDVSTKKIIGYVKTDTLLFVDYIPHRPYLYYVFDVQYHIGDGTFNDSAFLDEVTVTCAYYGDYVIGTKTYCYVLRGDTFGYIPKPTTLSFEENTEYADRLAITPPKTSSSPTADNASPSQIAILIALCLLVPVLAALIIKPPKKPPRKTAISL